MKITQKQYNEAMEFLGDQRVGVSSSGIGDYYAPVERHEIDRWIEQQQTDDDFTTCILARDLISRLWNELQILQNHKNKIKDIVARLRSPEHEHGGTGGPILDQYKTKRLMREAADLIEAMGDKQ